MLTLILLAFSSMYWNFKLQMHRTQSSNIPSPFVTRVCSPNAPTIFPLGQLPISFPSSPCVDLIYFSLPARYIDNPFFPVINGTDRPRSVSQSNRPVYPVAVFVRVFHNYRDVWFFGSVSSFDIRLARFHRQRCEDTATVLAVYFNGDSKTLIEFVCDFGLGVSRGRWSRS